MDRLDETDVLILGYCLLKRKRNAEKQLNKSKRRFWVHPLLDRRVSEDQFSVFFQTLRSDPQQFLDYCRMSITSFDELLKIIREDIRKVNTRFRLSISPEERYLSTGLNFQSLQSEFSSGHTTIRKIVEEVSTALWNRLQPNEMPEPTTQRWLDISDDFFSKSNFPNCVGAINGKKINITNPKHRKPMFGDYSIVLLAVSDTDGCFTAIDVACYSDEENCDIFKESALGKKVMQTVTNFPADRCFPGDGCGFSQPFFLVGDEAFPLRRNLMRPFPEKLLDDDKKMVFNNRLSRARRNVECSFAVLGNKWRVLSTPILVNLDHVVSIVKACCILHNFVAKREGVNFEDTLSCSLLDFENACAKNSTTEAKSTRDYLVNYFYFKNRLSWLK